MKFASLGSGSSGNATLIQSGDVTLLLDCGFSVRELEKRVQPLGIDLASIDAVLITHEHQDHIKGLGALARKYGMPVWMTHGTWHNAKYGKIPELNLFGSHDAAFAIGALTIAPFAVPHDAREPVQYIFTSNQYRFGILTDVGSLTPQLINSLNNLDALLLEFNHDTDMLRNGPYPAFLQARVAGDYGHLSNDQAMQLLTNIDCTGLHHLLTGHLSEKNNHPDLIHNLVRGFSEKLHACLSILPQCGCNEWFVLDK